MTESEAIEVLKQPCYCDYNLSATIEDCDISSCDKRDAMKLAIKALEKQIPKKPSPIDYKKYIDVVKNAKFLRGGFWCANCKHVVYSGCYCADCGQKLDWSDEE